MVINWYKVNRKRLFLLVRIKGSGFLVLGLGTQPGVYPPNETNVQLNYSCTIVSFGGPSPVGCGPLGYVSSYFHYMVAAIILG